MASSTAKAEYVALWSACLELQCIGQILRLILESFDLSKTLILDLGHAAAKMARNYASVSLTKQSNINYDIFREVLF